MNDQIEVVKTTFSREVQEVNTSLDVERLEVQYLGKKGPIQDLMKHLKEVSKEERPSFGKAINDLKCEIADKLGSLKEAFFSVEEEERLKGETIDVTVPGRRRYLGGKHLVKRELDRMIEVLIEMGFSVQDGPEIETDYYNFKALNFPEDHPAMDMQDTFYIRDDVLLRTHTSNIQTRFLESNDPPIRIIAPGRVYRNEDVSARSHVFFHQVDAVYVDRDVTFSDLIATMEQFLRKLFYPSIEIRVRPSYFPFVEPGMEVDIACLVCGGEGCPICKHTGWLEVAGAGMIHPEVLKTGGIDPDEYSGYAWGMGVERMVMLKYGIKDIRIFTENDLRFLRQFV